MDCSFRHWPPRLASGVLRNGDEFVWRYEATLRMHPTHQRLDADRARCFEVNLRLIEDNKLIIAECTLEVLCDCQPAPDFLVGTRLISTDLFFVAAGMLESPFGAAEQRFAVVSVLGRDGIANSAAYMEAKPVNFGGVINRFSDDA